MTPGSDPLNKKAIGLIIVWMGEWPTWTAAWLKSCSWNLGVKWLIFCEKPPPSTNVKAPNVFFHVMSQSDLERRTERVLGVHVDLKKAYKIADLKPIYGEMFVDLLDDCEFWGWADLDMIWGKIEHFFTAERRRDHDVLSAYRCCLCGPINIFRNNEQGRGLWREIPDFAKQVCETDATLGVDEIPLNDQLLKLENAGRLKVWRRQLLLNDCKQPQWHEWSLRVEAEDPVTDYPYTEWWLGSAAISNECLFRQQSEQEMIGLHMRIWKTPFNEQLPFPVREEDDVMIIDSSGIWSMCSKHPTLSNLKAIFHGMKHMFITPSKAWPRLRFLIWQLRQGAWKKVIEKNFSHG